MRRDAGLHVIFDGFVEDSASFSKEKLEKLFKDLATALDMRIILGPEFLEVELDPSKLESDVFQDEGGITGMCVISTSHMSIHCWPVRKCFSMDVFSCKDFNAARAVEIVRVALGTSSVEIVELRRNFPAA